MKLTNQHAYGSTQDTTCVALGPGAHCKQYQGAGGIEAHKSSKTRLH